jgi:uroporphyrinogen decarboxylase
MHLPKERFLDICRFKRTGDLYILPFFNSFWKETLEDWVRQGAPEKILDEDFCSKYFKFDPLYTLDEIKTGPYNIEGVDIGNVLYEPCMYLTAPPMPIKIIARDEHTITLINPMGQTVMVNKENPRYRMPKYLDSPVKDRASWEKYRERVDPNTPERWPADWDEFVQKINSKIEPKMMHVGGFYGFIREWMGTERILYTFYDDPGLIEDMMDQICYLEIECIKRVLKEIKISCALFWEDMCYKTGPLISPKMVRKFMMPRYRKITDLLRAHGIDVIIVDSDGNVNELIPLWLECGINATWPLECAAGNDAVMLRKKYGKDLILIGNIDKRALIKGKDAVKDEVISKVPFLLKTGGYFPSVDHHVPSDITLENYRYFINAMREVAGLEKLPELL